MQKTGIQSIDKFFNYGQSSANLERQPFTPLIQTVIEMFESQYTENLHDRKAKSIINFCKQRHNGFYYQQIEPLTKIFEYAKQDLFNQVYQMIPAIQTILNVDSGDKYSMFNKNAASDELRYLRVTPAYLNSLNGFLRYDQKMQVNEQMQGLRQSVVVYIRKFAEREIPQIIKKEQSFENQKSQIQQVSPIETLRIQGTKHLRAIAESQVIDALVRLLYDYDNQPGIIYPLMETFAFFSMYSRLSYVLCQKGVLPMALQIMLLCQDFRNNLVKTAFQIIWSSIECVGIQSLVVLAKQEYIFSIKDLFLRVIQQGYKLDDKCLRNEILILVNYLLSLPEAIDLFLTCKQLQGGKVQPSFLEVLFQYANIDENRFYDTKTRVADRKVQFGTNAEDLQLKKLFWGGLLTAIESNHDKVIEIAIKSDFIKYLLVYIDTTNNCYAVSRWSSPQLKELQKSALSIISNVILYMKNDFEDKKGIFCLTKFLSNVTDIERRQKCLKAFSNASLFEQAYKLRISEEGVFDYLIQFLQGQDNPVQIKQECFTIIANLCQGCKKNKKLFREKNGVDIVIGYLKDQNIATSNRYALLGLSLLNCLWNAILGSRRSQEIFLNSQGMFDLLQFIEVCEYSHRKMSLSCLSYLIQNSKAINQFLDWNSQKTMTNATQLLIKIYQQEDQRFGVKYEQGVIKNKSRPLIPADKRSGNISTGETYLKDFTDAGTETYLVNRIKQEVEEYDLRLIIFSILYRIGFNKNDLNAHEQQKIQVIQMYPHFKMGEIWGQIKNQLKIQEIKPTEDDRHWMETSIEQFQQQINNCVNTQSLIMKEFHKTQEGDLAKFYSIIKTNKQMK